MSVLTSRLNYGLRVHWGLFPAHSTICLQYPANLKATAGSSSHNFFKTFLFRCLGNPDALFTPKHLLWHDFSYGKWQNTVPTSAFFSSKWGKAISTAGSPRAKSSISWGISPFARREQGMHAYTGRGAAAEHAASHEHAWEPAQAPEQCTTTAMYLYVFIRRWRRGEGSNIEANSFRTVLSVWAKVKTMKLKRKYQDNLNKVHHKGKDSMYVIKDGFLL